MCSSTAQSDLWSVYASYLPAASAAEAAAASATAAAVPSPSARLPRSLFVYPELTAIHSVSAVPLAPASSSAAGASGSDAALNSLWLLLPFKKARFLQDALRSKPAHPTLPAAVVRVLPSETEAAVSEDGDDEQAAAGAAAAEDDEPVESRARRVAPLHRARLAGSLLSFLLALESLPRSPFAASEPAHRTALCRAAMDALVLGSDTFSRPEVEKPLAALAARLFGSGDSKESKAASGPALAAPAFEFEHPLLTAFNKSFMQFAEGTPLHCSVVILTVFVQFWWRALRTIPWATPCLRASCSCCCACR